MELKKVEELLHKLNFVASYQGYPTTVYLIPGGRAFKADTPPYPAAAL